MEDHGRMHEISEIMSEKTLVRPQHSRAASSFDPFRSEIALPQQPARPHRKFRSSRLHGEHPKPWLKRLDKRALWGTAILYAGAILGLGAGIAISYFDLKTAPLATVRILSFVSSTEVS